MDRRQFAEQCGHGGYGSRSPADHRARAALRTHLAQSDHLDAIGIPAQLMHPGDDVRVHLPAALNGGALGASAHHTRIGSRSEQVPEAGHDHGFTRPGLTGQSIQSRT